TFTMSFDVHNHNQPKLELYGTEGSLFINDPNCFDGEIKLYSGKTKSFTEMGKVNPFSQQERGLGLAQMCKSIEENELHYANGDRGLHVLEVMESIEKSSETNAPVQITTEVPAMPHFTEIK
ncbi:MAG: gfo/Idh/MocA family oxidoreductase, partial [Clostridia bacterium]|nr:gfo/Idh/MocA family oxidoreductase [Clostridia bacterium]